MKNKKNNTKNKQDTIFGCTLEDLQDMCDNSRRSKQTILGYIAEYKLSKILKTNQNIQYVKDANSMTDKGDFIVVYSDVSAVLECKTLKDGSETSTYRVKILDCPSSPDGIIYKGTTKVHYSTPREVIMPDGKKIITNRMYIKNIDILCCGFFNPQKKDWEFIFINSFNLPTLVGSTNGKSGGISKINDDIPPEYEHLFFNPLPDIYFPPRDEWSYDLNEILEKHVEYVKNNSSVIVPQKENKQFTLFD